LDCVVYNIAQNHPISPLPRPMIKRSPKTRTKYKKVMNASQFIT